MAEPFATVNDIKILFRPLTDAETERAEALLPLVSDLIRAEGEKCGVDVDGRIVESSTYASTVKLVTCDVVSRAMRQSTTGDSLSQESQSALGYTWSGTYAIPGGGVAMSLMNNEKKLLGFKRQRYGVIELWDGSQDAE